METQTSENKSPQKPVNPQNCAQCNIKISKSNSFSCTRCGNFNCTKHSWWLLPSGKKEIQPFCSPCYKEVNPLGMSKTFEVYGPEDGLPIVAIHGALGNRRQWQPQISELSKYYRVYVPDLPGHGSRFEETFTVESGVDVIANLIESQIPSKKALLIGYSLGGYLLMNFIARKPHLCAAAIIGGSPTNMQGFLQKMTLKFLAFLGDNLSPITMSGLAIKAGLRAGVSMEAMEVLTSTGATCNYQAEREINEVLGYPNHPKDISSYDGPILFIHGEKEDSRSGEQLFLSSAKNGKLVIIKGANHLLTHIPKYNEEFIKHILEFAESVGWKKATNLTQ